MGTSISMKWSKDDQALQAWRDLQPEKDSDLIRAALYALMEKRTGRGFQTASGPTPDTPEWVERFLQAIDQIPAAVRDGVLGALQQDPLIQIYRNNAPDTPAIAEPVIKAKRPKKSNHVPPRTLPRDSDPEALEAATTNFMNAFG